MVISNNKKVFSNLTAGTSGTLRTSGGYVSGQNELFAAFKPATYCKTWGYLRLKLTGSIYVSGTGIEDFRLYVNLTKPGLTNIPMNMVLVSNVPEGNSVFSANIDIPVGTGGNPEDVYALVTSHFNTSSSVRSVAAYIDAGPDEVITATITYASTTSLQTGEIMVNEIITEYLEA